MSKDGFDEVLAPHPVLRKLSSKGTNHEATGAVAISGFVGTAESTGRVRLYSSLRSLESWIEIDRLDILHAAVANQDLQSVMIWLRSDSKIIGTMSCMQSNGGSPISLEAIPAGPLLNLNDPDVIPVSRGRIRMLLRKQAAAALFCGAWGGTGGRCVSEW